MKLMFPRWFVTESDALPDPQRPTMRRPSPSRLMSAFAHDANDIFFVDGAVATTLNDELNGIRRLIVPFIDEKR